MALRARKPEAVTKRLKLFMFGPAGVGKTTAAIQFPNSYIIDCERGSENYDKLITESGSAVFQTTDIQEVIAEVKSVFGRQRRLELVLHEEAANTAALANVFMTLADNKVTLVSIRSVGQQTEQAFLDLVEKEEAKGFARAYQPPAEAA